MPMYKVGQKTGPLCLKAHIFCLNIFKTPEPISKNITTFNYAENCANLMGDILKIG